MKVRGSIFEYINENLSCGPNIALHKFEGKIYSLQEIISRARKLTGLLSSIGLRHGERVALFMHDCPEMTIATLGVMGLGAIAMPCNTSTSASQLAYILENSDASLVILTADLEEIARKAIALKGVSIPVIVARGETRDTFIPFSACNQFQEIEPHSVDSDAIALLMYTSGSTGNPKGALHRHESLCHTIELMGRNIFEIERGDRILSAPRLFFSYGFANSLSFPISLGATSILRTEKPSPSVLIESIKQDRPTIMMGVPANYRAILDQIGESGCVDFGSLKFAVSAGERLPVTLYHEWRDRTGVPILDMLGSTEVLYGYVSNRRSIHRAGSSGTPVPGYKIKLQDGAENLIKGPGLGRLYVKGPSILSGYWKNPEKTQAAVNNSWYDTGDIYRRDQDGFLFHEGRGDDMFKSSGLWVSPTDVEEILLRHVAVAEAAVTAEQTLTGANIVAWIGLRSGWPVKGVTRSIMLHIEVHLPKYKRPMEIRLIDEMPRTSTGKIQRYRLREISDEAAAAAI